LPVGQHLGDRAGDFCNAAAIRQTGGAMRALRLDHSSTLIAA
jgi:hypothetical protein